MSPERIAAEEKGDWARYTANEDDAHLGEDLYFNNTTGNYKVEPHGGSTGETMRGFSV